jgi:Na+-driven multidrug efflux pump
MGAGDVAWLRTVTIVAALVGFLPLSLLSGWLDWGLPGVWTGLTLFIVLRLVAVGWRVRGTAWLGETVAA